MKSVLWRGFSATIFTVIKEPWHYYEIGMLCFLTPHSIVQDSQLWSRNWIGKVFYLSHCTTIEAENYTWLIYRQDSYVFLFLKHSISVTPRKIHMDWCIYSHLEEIYGHRSIALFRCGLLSRNCISAFFSSAVCSSVKREIQWCEKPPV